MTSLAIVRDDRYLDHIAGEGHPESPNRLKVIHALLDAEFPDLPRITPREAAESELALIHDPFYIQRVAGTAGRIRSQLDPDTGLSARSYDVARLAAGGLLAAVDSLLSPAPGPRTPSSAFAFVRPPGHHAEPDRGMGFCLFNNVAIAAAYAREQHKLKRVLIVDWDLHHGNGTQRAFWHDPGVLFFSSHQYPYYPGSGGFDEVGEGDGRGFTVNAPFPTGFGDTEYVHVYSRILRPIACAYQPELILVSAGFDPFFQDPLGGMEVTAAGFGALAQLVRSIADEVCGGKVLITLEGGYDPEGLRSGVRSVLQAFLAGQTDQTQTAKSSAAAEQVAERIIKAQKQFWKTLA